MSQANKRTRIGRLPERGVTDKKQIYEILDEGFVCHVGFSVDGQPYVMPMVYGREGDQLYVHGAALSRIARSLAEGIPVCVEVTLVDGLVLARSAFHHSVNYRSVVVLGKARTLTATADKMKALRCITNHAVPNRWSEARPPNAEEMAATTVLAVPLDELSAKVRKGPPKDDQRDMALAVWAGVLPLRTRLGEPVADANILPGVEVIDPGRLPRFTS
jgi:nitroimidazol reductase NimA-like FMN-containing flavoprotein (pyridoxamine 5'-phosphate oxidase superfamily)